MPIQEIVRLRGRKRIIYLRGLPRTDLHLSINFKRLNKRASSSFPLFCFPFLRIDTCYYIFLFLTSITTQKRKKMKIIQQRLVLFGFLKFLLAALAPDNYSIFPSTPKNTTLTLVHGLQVSLTRTSPGGAANNAGGQHDPRDAYVATRGGLVRVPPNNVWPQQAGAAAGAGHQGLPGEGAAPAAGDDHAIK
eukprot:GSA120T00022368001.1